MAKFRYLQQTRTFETKAGLRIKIGSDMFVLQHTGVHITPCLLPHPLSHRLAMKSSLLNAGCKSSTWFDLLLLLRAVPVEPAGPCNCINPSFKITH